MMGIYKPYVEIFGVATVVLLCGIIRNASASQLKCKMVVSDDFSMCLNPFRNKTNFEKMQKILNNPEMRMEMYNTFNKPPLEDGKPQNGPGQTQGPPHVKRSSNSNSECENPKICKCEQQEEKDICNREFTATVVDLMPFSMQMMHDIDRMLKGCCGGCATFRPRNTIKYMSKVNSSAIMSSDIVFPILGRSSVESLYGYYFLPILDAPSAYYVTTRLSKSEVSQSITDAIKHLWPLLTICFLFALISGFIAWVMETQANTEEFPTPFHIGLFEGFWWSFVSMTTVGYGDKAPKSRFRSHFCGFLDSCRDNRLLNVYSFVDY